MIISMGGGGGEGVPIKEETNPRPSVSWGAVASSSFPVSYNFLEFPLHIYFHFTFYFSFFFLHNTLSA